ncbi:hypothetical protein CKK33_04910 [Mucilaginibacter sp. MD40]|uniref:BT_3987 domain-containing protein n=1 Tax=Mucilaginibacter sp. MD40 TaxID=2029590 RepID=UPI000BAC52D6|nr:DUF1735 domain-containing protein [Mucilaginibacter sp. MD40]PAW92864.1 hypothetical protein CKK33_04910 [Mucilaginibacter sp. MD40]
MKRNLKIKSYIMLGVTALLGLSSCLKDSRYIDFSKNEPLVEFPLAANAGVLQSAAFDISNNPSNLQVAVNVASPAPLTSALDVTVGVQNQAALDAFNTANGTTYTLLPAAAYSLPAKVTVPANQRIGILNVTINSSKIDPSGNYALPLIITDASGKKISNYNTIVYGVSVKNQYDGVYTSTGTRVHPTLGPFPFNYTVTMSTAGATSITGGALADLRSDLKITVNADNSVSLSSNAQPSVTLTPGGVNKYDPATKTFTLTYYYNTAAPRTITQVLKKQ